MQKLDNKNISTMLTTFCKPTRETPNIIKKENDIRKQYGIRRKPINKIRKTFRKEEQLYCEKTLPL